MEKSRKNSKNKMQIPRGGVTRPPSQFESYSLSASSKSYSGRSYSAPKPYAPLISINCRYGEFSNTRLGGRVRKFVQMRVHRAFPVKNKGNQSYKEPKEAISTRNISICRNGGRPRSLGLVKHDASDTSQTSYQLCPLALVRFVSNGERRKFET